MTPLLTVLVVCALTAAASAVPEDCGQPKQRGTCGQFAVRYYYDTEYGGCLRFWYGGCDGNGNRFETESECERACVSPAGDDLCRLPAVRGACKRAKTRWYSDPASGGCREFTYSGCLGNDNRFDSESACQRRCGRVTPDSGSGGTGGGIGGGWVSTTTAAPGPAGCLLPDRVAGDCSQYVIRYSYVAARQQCAPFYYGGCGGNGNRFDTAEACQAACLKPPTTRPPYYAPAAPRDRTAEQPAVWGGRDTRPYSGREDDRTSYDREEDGYGREEDRSSYGREERPRPGATPRRLQPGSRNAIPLETDICSLPSDRGRCRAYMPSYYFNSATGRCDRFIYGGCGGNENRFSTLKECEKRCGGTEDTPTDDVCSLPSDKGRCRAYMPSYYFNSAAGRCDRFIYGGCGGNENRFNTLEECEKRCGGAEDRPAPTESPRQPYRPETDAPYEPYRPTSPPKPEPEIPGSAPEGDICSLPSDRGRCRAYNPSYYFNSAAGRCDRFIYGGCGGNENRFSTLKECEERCGGEEDRPAPTESPRRPSQPETEAPYVPYQRTSEAPPEPEPEVPDTAAPDVDICSLPSDRGRCRAYNPSYYFNSATGRCDRFIYGGCGGNENRFNTLAECEDRCGGGARRPEVQPTEPPTPIPPETEQPETEAPDAVIALPTAAELDACQLPPKAGPCDQRLPRYYFNGPLSSCFTFTYSGCGGNANRFSSADECRARCLTGEPEATYAPFDPDFGGAAAAGVETTTLGDYPTFDYNEDEYGMEDDDGIDTSAPVPPDYYDEYYAESYDEY